MPHSGLRADRAVCRHTPRGAGDGLGDGGFTKVYASTPVEVCEQRDRNGWMRRRGRGSSPVSWAPTTSTSPLRMRRSSSTPRMSAHRRRRSRCSRSWASPAISPLKSRRLARRSLVVAHLVHSSAQVAVDGPRSHTRPKPWCQSAPWRVNSVPEARLQRAQDRGSRRSGPRSPRRQQECGLAATELRNGPRGADGATPRTGSRLAGSLGDHPCLPVQSTKTRPL